MTRSAKTTLLIALVVGAGFWVSLAAMAAIGVGPLSKFHPAQVTAENFDSIVGTLGAEERVLERLILVPAWLAVSIALLRRFRILPDILGSVAVCVPLSCFAGHEMPTILILLVMYSAAHLVVHHVIDRALESKRGERKGALAD